MDSHDIAGEPGSFGEVVPNVDVVFVDGSLAPENVLGVVVTLTGVECASVKNRKGRVVGVDDQAMCK